MTAPVWRRSSRCGASNTCVEIGYGPQCSGVLVADSADPHGPVLTLTRGELRALLTAIKEMP